MNGGKGSFWDFGYPVDKTVNKKIIQILAKTCLNQFYNCVFECLGTNL